MFYPSPLLDVALAFLTAFSGVRGLLANLSGAGLCGRRYPPPSRIADFYDAKLQRSRDRAIGVVGPLAIVVISLIVGGLIVSVMTALLSYQVVS
jgi:hypothetical protein